MLERPIADSEVLVHSVEASDYWQGCGTWGTRFELACTGIGDTVADAYEDALDQLACSGWSLDGHEFGFDPENEDRRTVADVIGSDYDPEGDHHWRVTVRVR